MKTAISIAILALALTACGSGSAVQTDPAVIGPVLVQLTLQCERDQEHAICADVQQLLACLQGNEAYCPMKGYGAF